MKYWNYCVLLCFLNVCVQAQSMDDCTPCPLCPAYNQYIEAGQGYLYDEIYDKALNEFQAAQVAARLCNCATNAPADYILQAIQGIQQQRNDALKAKERAEAAEQKAKNALSSAKKAEAEAKKEAQRAEAEKRKALQAQTAAEKAKQEAQETTREALANDLAFKGELALKDKLRTPAFRLAEFAHLYVQANNKKAQTILSNTWYHNDRLSPPPP